MKILSLAGFSLFVLLISGYAFLNPLYNWDVLGYTAAALSYDIHSRDSLHQQTYSIAQNTIPPAQYRDLISCRYPLRVRAAQDSGFFNEQLFAFKVKPLYIFLIYLLFKIHVPVIMASVVISIAAVIVICLIVFVWLSRYLSAEIAGLFTMLLALAVRLPSLAQLSTPDALSTAIILGYFYLLLEKRQMFLSCLLLLVSITARFDNIILVWLMLGYLSFLAPPGYALSKNKGMLFFALSILVLVGIFFAAQTGLWLSLAHNVLLGLNTDVSASGGMFSLREYFWALFLGWARIMWDNKFPSSVMVFLAWGLVVLFYKPRMRQRDGIAIHIVSICILSILIHYIFYPQFIDRLYSAYYLMIVIMSLRPLNRQTLKAGESELGTFAI